MKNKKDYIILLAIVSFFHHNGLPQCGDLIINGTFEKAAFDYLDDLHPMGPAHIYQVNPGGDDEYLHAWETDQRYVTDNATGQTKWVHSPDWFKRGYNSQNIPFHDMREIWIDPDPNGTNIYTTAKAHTGKGYIGMNDAELVEQELSDNLIEGDKYSLQMYIRPVKKTNMGAYYSNTHGWTGGAKFRAWLAKDNIKYKHNNYDDDCTDDNDLFSTPLVDKIEILNLNLNLSDFNENSDKTKGVYEWKKISVEFTAPYIGDLEANYNWLVIELAGNSTTYPCNVYLLIDDVSLKPGCTQDNSAEYNRSDGDNRRKVGKGKNKRGCK